MSGTAHNTETSSRKERDWISLLAPTLLAVSVALGIQLVGYIWLSATTQARVANMELRLKIVEDTIRDLPNSYVPRVELVRGEQITKEQRELEQQRLNRMEQKLDTLLERK